MPRRATCLSGATAPVTRPWRRRQAHAGTAAVALALFVVLLRSLRPLALGLKVPPACPRMRPRPRGGQRTAERELIFDAAAVAKEDRVPLLLSYAQSLGVAESIGVDASRIEAFIGACLDLMPLNPFHGPAHVVDVVQSLTFIVYQSGLADVLHPMQVAGLFLAAVGHDVLHTGCSNALLISERHHLAWEAEKGVGPLETMHARRTRMALEKHVLPGLAPDEAAELQEGVRQTIHGTDMGNHSSILADFRKALEEQPFDSNAFFQPHSSRGELLLRVLLKAADISNPGRPWEISTEWNRRIFQEFYAEGDEDRAAGREVNPMFDRVTNSIPKSSVGFIRYVVRDLYLALREFLDSCREDHPQLSAGPVEAALRQMERNEAAYAAMVDSAL